MCSLWPTMYMVQMRPQRCCNFKALSLSGVIGLLAEVEVHMLVTEILEMVESAAEAAEEIIKMEAQELVEHLH